MLFVSPITILRASGSKNLRVLSTSWASGGYMPQMFGLTNTRSYSLGSNPASDSIAGKTSEALLLSHTTTLRSLDGLRLSGWLLISVCTSDPPSLSLRTDRFLVVKRFHRLPLAFQLLSGVLWSSDYYFFGAGGSVTKGLLYLFPQLLLRCFISPALLLTVDEKSVKHAVPCE